MRYVWVLLRARAVLQRAGNWTDGEAEPAARAICGDFRLVSLGVEGNGLVAGVKAGHEALAAVDAEIVVDDWELLLFGHVVDVLEVL